MSKKVLSANTTQSEKTIMILIPIKNKIHGRGQHYLHLQEQPKHLRMERKFDGVVSGSGSSFLHGRCLKNAFTAPVTPSSFSMAFASLTARSLTCKKSIQFTFKPKAFSHLLPTWFFSRCSQMKVFTPPLCVAINGKKSRWEKKPHNNIKNRKI